MFNQPRTPCSLIFWFSATFLNIVGVSLFELFEVNSKLIAIIVVVLIIAVVGVFLWRDFDEEAKLMNYCKMALETRQNLTRASEDAISKGCNDTKSCGLIETQKFFLEGYNDTRTEYNVLENYCGDNPTGERPSREEALYALQASAYELAYQVVMLVSASSYLNNETSERFLAWEAESIIKSYKGCRKRNIPAERLRPRIETLLEPNLFGPPVDDIILKGAEEAYNEFIPVYLEKHYQRYVKAVKEKDWLRVAYERIPARACVNQTVKVSPPLTEVRKELDFIRNTSPFDFEMKLDKLSEVIGKDLVCKAMTEEEKKETGYCPTP